MKKHKLICSFLAALLTAAALSGCGSDGNSKSGDKAGSLLDPENPVTVTVWHYYNGVQQTTFDEMVEEFNETEGFEKGIIVESYSKSSIDELKESILSSVREEPGAEESPDIFATYSETAYVIDKLGKLVDFKDYLTQDELDEYVSEYLDEGSFSSDTLKIFPTAKSTEVMMINKTDWDKFAAETGVTEADLSTIERLVDTAEKYYEYTDALTPDTPNDGKAFFGRDSIANYMYIGAKQLGDEYVSIDDEGEATVTVTKETMRKLWDNYYVPYVKGYFASQSRYRSDDAKTGTIIALVCSTSGAAYFPMEVTIDDDYTYQIDNIVMNVPLFEGCDPYLVQQGAGMSVITSDEATEYASVEFLKWFTEEERNISFSISSGYLPVKKSANDFEKVKSANEKIETPMDQTMLDTLEVAINEIKEDKLYTSAPFDKSAETRDYIGSSMQNSASDDYAAVQERIAAGEDRDDVLNDYVNDDAFEKWYEDFVSGLEQVISE